MKPDHFLIPYTKIYSKWMKDLNVRQETIKILEKNTGSNLFDTRHSNFLLGMCLETRETKAKMNYWDLIKIKIICTVRKQSTRLKAIFGMGEDICSGLVSKSIKNLLSLTPKKQTIQLKRGQKTFIDFFFQGKHTGG